TKRDEGGGWEAPIAPLCDVSSVVPRGQRLRGRDGASGPAPGDRGADPMIGTKAPSPSAEAGATVGGERPSRQRGATVDRRSHHAPSRRQQRLHRLEGRSAL